MDGPASEEPASEEPTSDEPATDEPATDEPATDEPADGEPASFDGERGSATIEAAIAVCALVLVLAMAIGGVATVSAQLRCTDAASQAARLAARGDTDRAERVVSQLAPAGARLDIRIRGDEVVAVVTAAPVGGRLAGITVRAEAVAVLEPGVSGVR